MPDESGWYEIEVTVDQEEVATVNVSDKAFYLRAPIKDIIVVQIPGNLPPRVVQEVFAKIQATMKGAGIERPVLVMPDFVKFAKFKKVNEATSKALDAVKKKRFGLTPDTKVAGNA